MNSATEFKIIERQYNHSRNYKSFNKAPRVYVRVNDESIFDNLTNRRNRPVKLFRQAASKALTENGIYPKKLRWSQYAGCSCPCSPGFILDDYDFDKGIINSFRFDVWVTIGENK